MYPVFNLGPLEFPAYFTFLTLGYTLVVMLAWRETFQMERVSPVKLLDLSILLFFAGLVGARLMHVLVDGYFDEYVKLCVDPLTTKPMDVPAGFLCRKDADCVAKDAGELCNLAAGTCHQARDCFRALKFWYGGLAFYGGLFLAAFAGVLYIRKWRRELDFLSVADLAGFGIALGLFFGRMGCWFGGCCFGKVCDSPLAVHFPKYSPAWEKHVEAGQLLKTATESLPVIPVQLLQAMVNLATFAVCYLMFKRYPLRNGRVFGLFLILNGVGRFILEYWRDDFRGLWFGEALSSSQVLGIPIVLIGLAFWFLGPRFYRSTAPANAESPTVDLRP